MSINVLTLHLLPFHSNTFSIIFHSYSQWFVLKCLLPAVEQLNKTFMSFIIFKSSFFLSSTHYILLHTDLTKILWTTSGINTSFDFFSHQDFLQTCFLVQPIWIYEDYNLCHSSYFLFSWKVECNSCYSQRWAESNCGEESRLRHRNILSICEMSKGDLINTINGSCGAVQGTKGRCLLQAGWIQGNPCAIHYLQQHNCYLFNCLNIWDLLQEIPPKFY